MADSAAEAAEEEDKINYYKAGQKVDFCPAFVFILIVIQQLKLLAAS